MSSSVFTTSYMFLALVFWCLNSAKASSIYVGRHEAAAIPESQTSESVHVIPEVSCQDSNNHLCKRILTVFGENICMTNDKVLLLTLQDICRKSCGFCDTDCQDQFEDLCEEYASSCNTEGDLGRLMKEICPKTCRSCHLRPHKQSELVVIHEDE